MLLVYMKSISKEAIEMKFEQYFGPWLDKILSPFDFSIFCDFRYVAIIVVLFLLLKSKIGNIKALIFPSSIILFLNTTYTNLVTSGNPVSTTLIFAMMTACMVIYAFYSMFIGDQSS